VPLIDVDDSVLVVIDVQRGFVEKVDAETADAVVDRIRWLCELAAALHVPAVVTEESPDHNGPTAPAVVAALPTGLHRYPKTTFGLGESPEILAAVEATRRRTAVLCGLETDVCVAQSAIGLHDRGWRVAVAADATASPGAAHEQGLTRLRDAGIELVGVKAVGYDWLRSVERAELVLEHVVTEGPRGIVL